jgi:D-amino-acid dehydrogenase
MGDELRFSGRFELSNLDMSPSTLGVSQIENLIRSHLTIDAHLTVKDRRAGLRPTTPDGVPIVGTTHHWRNVTYATGQAMLGLSLGSATGCVTAQLVFGEAPDVDVSRCSPLRFQ